MLYNKGHELYLKTCTLLETNSWTKKCDTSVFACKWRAASWLEKSKDQCLTFQVTDCSSARSEEVLIKLLVTE